MIIRYILTIYWIFILIVVYLSVIAKIHFHSWSNGKVNYCCRLRRTTSEQHIQLNYHRIKYITCKGLSLAAANFISLSSQRYYWGLCAWRWWRVPQPPPFPRPLCLHSLFYDVIPYWGQIVPSTIPTEARIQGSDENGFLHPSFKSPGFCCQDFSSPLSCTTSPITSLG